MKRGAQVRSVLLTGGAGYIGSHAAFALLDSGYQVVIIDDLSTGVRENMPPEATFYEVRLQDRAEVRRILKQHDIGAVLHFAGSIQVGESVDDPLKYYENNTSASRSLVRDCVNAGVERFIFSSTAAVYGLPGTEQVNEQTPGAPINPYGWSKLMTEQILTDAAAAHGLAVGILRYFNVAGADVDGRTGQSTPDATHLIKVACETALQMRPEIQILGTDYPTPDGTGVRDYIHVNDLVDAHIRLLEFLDPGNPPEILNCGYGHGYSVLEVLDGLERVSGLTVPRRDAPRREGDPAKIVADNSHIRARLGWSPRYDDLDVILKTALDWERKRCGKS